MGLLPQLELLAVFSCRSGHNNMSKQCNRIQKVSHIVSSTNSARCWRQVNYMFSVHAKLSYANTASKPLNRRLTSSQSLVLLLSIVLGSAAKIVSREATNWTRCKEYSAFFKVTSLLSLFRGSSADSAEFDIQ